MVNLLNKIVVSNCGRIFLKNSRYRSIFSFENTPTLTGTFNRYIERNNLKKDDFIRTDSNLRNSSGKLLYYYKYKKITIPYLEVFGCSDSNGYTVVNLYGRLWKFHRVVMAYTTNDYIENAKKYEELQVNHIDGDKSNNNPSNLEWCTCQENIQHAWDMRLAKVSESRNNNSSETKLSKLDISYMFEDTCKETKYRMFRKLKNRGYDVSLYVFIKTGKDKSNHGLGYLEEIK